MVNPLRIFSGHLSDVDSVKFHPYCNYLATGSSDRTVRLCDIPSSQYVMYVAVMVIVMVSHNI